MYARQHRTPMQMDFKSSRLHETMPTFVQPPLVPLEPSVPEATQTAQQTQQT